MNYFLLVGFLLLFISRIVFANCDTLPPTPIVNDITVCKSDLPVEITPQNLSAEYIVKWYSESDELIISGSTFLPSSSSS